VRLTIPESTFDTLRVIKFFSFLPHTILSIQWVLVVFTLVMNTVQCIDINFLPSGALIKVEKAKYLSTERVFNA